MGLAVALSRFRVETMLKFSLFSLETIFVILAGLRYTISILLRIAYSTRTILNYISYILIFLQLLTYWYDSVLEKLLNSPSSVVTFRCMCKSNLLPTRTRGVSSDARTFCISFLYSKASWKL